MSCYKLFADPFSMIANIPEDLICLGLVMNKCQWRLEIAKQGRLEAFKGSKEEGNQPKNKNNKQKCPVNRHMKKHVPRIHGKGSNEIL